MANVLSKYTDTGHRSPKVHQLLFSRRQYCTNCSGIALGTSPLLLHSSSSFSSSYSNSPTILSKAFISRSLFFFTRETSEQRENVSRSTLDRCFPRKRRPHSRCCSPLFFTVSQAPRRFWAYPHPAGGALEGGTSGNFEQHGHAQPLFIVPSSSKVCRGERLGPRAERKQPNILPQGHSNSLRVQLRR